MTAFIIDQIKIVSDYGDSRILPIVVTIAFLLFLVGERYLKEAVVLLFSVASGIYVTVLKLLFKGPRPPFYQYNPYIVGDEFSFPSAHVVFYTAFWGYILYLTFKIKKLPLWLLLSIRIICVYFITLVGASRVLVGAHYIHDVVAGYFFGAVYLMFLIGLETVLRNIPFKSLKKGTKHKKQY